MSSPNAQTLIIQYTAEQHAEFETSYWLKLEQADLEPDTVSMSQAAELVDALYDTTPCVDSKKEKQAESPDSDTATTTTDEDKDTITPATDNPSQGGKESLVSDEESTLVAKDETAFLTIANGILGMNACKNDGSCHTAKLRVYRSHPAEPYKLVLDGGATITRTSVQTAEANETPGISSAAGYNLTYPLAGDLECGFISAAGEDGMSFDVPPEITVDGSTLSWGVNVTGILDIRYTTQFDLVEIKIPNKDDGSMGECNVFAYYHAMVYDCRLEPPKVDPTMTETDKEKFCLKSATGVTTNDHKQTCYEDVHHVYLCQCSNFESSASWDEEAEKPCPESFKNDSGRFVLGSRNVYDGVSDCGEVTACHSPDYYHYVCCKWPKVALPKCVASQSIYTGGKGIKGGAEAIMDEYGPKTKIVAIGPENGPCGFIITRQVTNSQSCCDLAEPLEWDQSFSGIVLPDYSSVVVGIIGGVPPYTWTISGQGMGFNPSTNQKKITTDWPTVKIYSGNACGSGLVIVTDGCTETRGTIRSTSGRWEPFNGNGCICSGGWVGAWGWSNFYIYTCDNGAFKQQAYVGYQRCGEFNQPWCCPTSGPWGSINDPQRCIWYNFYWKWVC